MKDYSLFIHVDGECTYYDYFSNIENCLREVGYNLKKDKKRVEPASVMLTLATAMIGGRPIPDYVKCVEMIRFTRYFMNPEGLAKLVEMFHGSYVSSGIMLLHNACMTPNDFEIYETVVKSFFSDACESIGAVKQKSVRTAYLVAKNEVYDCFNVQEKVSDRIDTDEEEVSKKEALKSPYKLAKYLKKYVKGQDNAVDIFANIAFQYNSYVKKDRELPKPYNILIIGPSGSGKTTLMKAFNTLAKVHMVDCTGVTESGYKGTDAKDIVKDSKYGNIVFYDEFDKLLMPSIDGSGRDTHKEVQGCFYKLMEESDALNIFAGAFEGIDDIVKKRLKTKYSFMGFSTDKPDLDNIDVNDVTEQDLLTFGASREFTGRIDVIIKMRSLTEKDFEIILKDGAYSPVKSEIKIANDCYGIDLEVTDEFYMELARKAADQDIGARALKQHINKVIDPILAEGMERGCDKVVISSLEDDAKFITKEKVSYNIR